MSLQQLEFALSAGSVPNDELARIQNAFSMLTEIRTLSRGLIGERAFFITVREETTPPGPLSLVSAFDNNFYLDYMGDLIQIAKLSPQEMLAEAEALEQRMNEDPLPFLHILTNTTVPALTRALEGEADIIVRCQLAILACAIERYRNDNGTLPDELPDLSPEYVSDIPTDPYSNAPYRYNRLDEGYLLYSVGRNGIDDGGSDERTASPNNPRRYPVDITFRVRR